MSVLTVKTAKLLLAQPEFANAVRDELEWDLKYDKDMLSSGVSLATGLAEPTIVDVHRAIVTALKAVACDELDVGITSIDLEARITATVACVVDRRAATEIGADRAPVTPSENPVNPEVRRVIELELSARAFATVRGRGELLEVGLLEVTPR